MFNHTWPDTSSFMARQAPNEMINLNSTVKITSDGQPYNVKLQLEI